MTNYVQVDKELFKWQRFEYTSKGKMDTVKPKKPKEEPVTESEEDPNEDLDEPENKLDQPGGPGFNTKPSFKINKRDA